MLDDPSINLYVFGMNYFDKFRDFRYHSLNPISFMRVKGEIFFY